LPFFRISGQITAFHFLNNDQSFIAESRYWLETN